MRDQEIIGLWEAYQQVHSQVEEVEQLDEDDAYDRNRRRAAQRAQARNEARARGQTGSVPGVGYVSPRPERATYTDSAGVVRHHTGARMPKKEDQTESYDFFNYLLEYLVAEGYANTNKAALAIMANMSEEWKQSIVEGMFDFLPKSNISSPGMYGKNTVLSMKKGVEGVSDKTKPGTFTKQPGGWDTTDANRYSDEKIKQGAESGGVNLANRRTNPNRIQ